MESRNRIFSQELIWAWRLAISQYNEEREDDAPFVTFFGRALGFHRDYRDLLWLDEKLAEADTAQDCAYILALLYHILLSHHTDTFFFTVNVIRGEIYDKIMGSSVRESFESIYATYGDPLALSREIDKVNRPLREEDLFVRQLFKGTDFTDQMKKYGDSSVFMISAFRK
jgi:hypothetical protein